MSLSVVILTKNEEANIKKCLDSVSFADEIILVDDDSSDETVEIAKKLGARVYKRALDSDFSKQRNYGLSKCKNKWVLFLDADEVVPQKLREEIIQLLNNSFVHAEGFLIKRTDFVWGIEIKHGESGNIGLLRLAQRKAGTWERRVHEVYLVTGRLKTLKFPIYHYPHQSMREFLTHINYWSDLHAKQKEEEREKSSLFKIIFWPLGHFIKNYFFKLGFLDGSAGLVFALVMSFHSFLAWAKLWKLSRN